MGRPYEQELSELPETYAWTQTLDVRGLVSSVRRASALPIVAIASGGALTAAASLVALHRRHAEALGAICTPLHVDSSLPADGRVSVWLISAGGRNKDIRAAFRAAVSQEPKHVVVLSGEPNSPLAGEARSRTWLDTHAYELLNRDGFLAVSSVLTFTSVLARAYGIAYASPPLPSSLHGLLARSFASNDSLQEESAELWSRPTLIVLHGVATGPAAMDLESRFCEAALGPVLVADYRNFAHGRHHWLAKHGATSAVIALVGPGDEGIAARTLAILPSTIPVRKFEFSGTPAEVLISSVVVSIKLAGFAGRERGVDPGRPGVPEFGRKLYNLTSPRPRTRPAIAPYKNAAIQRKAGGSIGTLESQGKLGIWTDALEAFEQRLAGARFRAIAVDYDGTLREGSDRTSPPGDDVSAQLDRLLTDGIIVGVATGRGDSILEPLRKVIDRGHWDRVLVGYHNGAEIRSLAECPPDSGVPGVPELLKAHKALLSDPSIRELADIRPHARQLTVIGGLGVSEDDLWFLVSENLRREQIRRVRTMRSSHSVDVLAPGVSKLRLVAELRQRSGGEVLCIGDRGRWPGNDHELLSTPWSLSVDEASHDPSTGWNLGPPGTRGVEVLAFYLAGLHETASPSGARFTRVS